MEGFKKVLAYASEHKNTYYWSIILIFFSVVMEIAPFLLAYHMLATFIEGDGGTVPYIIGMSVGIGGAMMLKTFFYKRGLVASHKVAFDTLMGMRKALADKMLKLPMGQIRNKGIGAYKKNFVDDIDNMEALIAHMIPEGLPYVISPLLVFIILFIVDWRLALLSMGSIPFGVVAMGAMMVTGMKRMENYYRSEERMNKTIVEYIAGMEVIKIFNRTTSSFAKYVKNVEGYRDYTLDWFNASWNWMAVYTAVLPCTVLLLVPFGLKFYLDGTLALSTYIFALMLAMSIGIPLVKMMEFIPLIPQLTFKINELESTFEGEELKSEDKGISPKDYTVVYDNITFGYDTKQVINNVSFKAEANGVTAIVGESGSGKSTLAKLLVKFWDVDGGDIRIGGVSTRDMSMERLYGLVSFVEQDTFLFDMPLIENIRLGRPEASDEEVYAAAKAAQCHDFITGLSKGYQTMPGSSGDKLSGGEKQRITIARAILKDAPIVVLDEATSAMDAENEDLIQEALNRLVQGKTLMVIAHRLSTIVEADTILLLEEGVLTGQGTHEGLLESSAKYRQLWDAHRRASQWDIHVREEDAVHA